MEYGVSNKSMIVTFAKHSFVIAQPIVKDDVEFVKLLQELCIRQAYKTHKINTHSDPK
jgi:hypothetical protein